MKHLKEYAIYKGDEFIELGNINYLSKKLGLRKNTIYTYLTNTYKKKQRIYEETIFMFEIEKDI